MPRINQTPASRSSLRILRVVHTLRREAGGPSESVLRSTAALGKLGHHVEIVTADPVDTPPPADTTFAFHPLGGSHADTLGAWLHARHQSFDAVLVHGLWQAGWTVRTALRGTGTPYLVFPHGMLDPWFRRAYPIKHFKKQLYWWLREGRVLSDAAAVCFTCDEERRLAQRTFFPYRAHEHVVAYGTAAPAVDREPLRTAFATRFPVLNNRRFLLFLGRIHEKKGVRELIVAYAKFRRTHPNAPALVIAGPCADARLADSLRQLATTVGLPQLDLRADNNTRSSEAALVWLPMLDDDLKWGALQSSEAFILPSHQENFGIAVAEALACGRPVLVSDKVNIWREISADGAGLVAADTEAGIADLLSRWELLDGPARVAMGLAAERCFAKRFEITGAAHSLAATIAACLPGKLAP